MQNQIEHMNPEFQNEKLLRVLNTSTYHEVRSINQVLSYEFEPLVSRISKEQNLEYTEAYELFQYLLKFLYICGAHPEHRPFYPPKMIDEAWHTFLIFTREYADFCRLNFDKFLHHSPLTLEEKAKRAELKNKSNKVVEIANELFVNLSNNWAVDGDCEQSCAPDYDSAYS